jgi:hypothetical protein
MNRVPLNYYENMGHQGPALRPRCIGPKYYSILLIVNVNHNGMACISPEVTVKSFKKCRTSNAVDATDYSLLWNGSKEDGDVKSEDEEDEGTDC